jgi:beta-mannosidase
MLFETYLHEGWEFIETKHDTPGSTLGYSNPEWLEAVVPGHVHLDLMQHGIIPHPHERMNEYGVQWVDETDWSYRTTFYWEPKEESPVRKLVFEGLDTVCKISLNGKEIASHDNMFVALEVDVTSLLVEGDNELRIDFNSAIRVGLERQTEFFKQEGLPEYVERFEERSFVRKIQCMYGWDWGPRLVSCGVWRPIRLVEFASRVTHLSATQEWHEDGSVTLTVHGETEGPAAIHYWLEIDDVTYESAEGIFRIEEPELWWPIGAGDQPLFELSAGVPEGENDNVYLDIKTIKVGFRNIKLLREKDDIGESFEFEVNGKKIYAKGFNWIPDYSFPSAITRERYEERLYQALDLGSNMLRIWGGGMYEMDEFYEICDELGIMVWQDFPQACAYYPDTQEWQDKIRPEAEFNVKRLRHHASLALWCGNNENLQMWQQKWNWKGGQHPPRFYGENLYDKLFPAVVSALNPETSYIHTSPCGESEPDANGGKIGDSHYWDAWHGRGDWKYYLDSEARFSSEYGFASSCSLALWEETISDEDWDYQSPAVRWHDKTRKGYSTFVGYVELHYPKSQSLEDWTYYSQLNQRDALRMGVEHFRRSAFCRGSLIWQLNDIWPVQSWAVIDSSGRYKASAHELRRLYSETLFSVERVKETVKVHFVDDRNEDAIDELPPFYVDYRLINLLTGEVVRSGELEFESEPGQRGIAGEIDLTGCSVPETILWLEGNFAAPTWHLLSEPKEARLANPQTIVGSNNISRDEVGDGIYFAVRIDHPVVDLMLSVDGDTGVFEDNFVTITEPGVYYFRASGPIAYFEARSLAGVHGTQMTRSPLE